MAAPGRPAAPLPSDIEPAELPADAIEVGRIADAWGIKGWFKVLPHSADPQALFSSKRWYLQPSEKGPQAFPARCCCACAKPRSTPTPWSPAPTASRTARRRGAPGRRIFVPRSSFPTAGDDEYYWVDLLGLDVVNREGVHLGRSRTAVHRPADRAGAGYEQDGKPQERMLPFVAAYVDGVDLPARRITVDWQPDY
jgi:16S rRNA processing protein RimM